VRCRSAAPGGTGRTTVLLTAVALVFTLLAAVPATADDLEEDLAEVSAQLDGVAASIEAAEGQRSDLAAEVVDTRGRVDSLLDRVAEVSTDLSTAREAVTDQRARIVTVLFDVRRPTGGADDTWRIDDVRIPIAGRWDVGVEVLINDFEQATVKDAVMLPRLP
jgi:hypothetical protein